MFQLKYFTVHLVNIKIYGFFFYIIQIGGRVEGFEFIFESFFGPNGYFPDDAILKMLTTAREQKSYDEKKLNEIEKIVSNFMLHF